MTITLGLLNILIGIVYTNYGTLTATEMMRGWRIRGFSHFGAAWIAMTVTCGPHHLAHGGHLLFEGRSAGPLDVLAVAIGVPAGLIWFALRVEAFRGGRGDRFISGDPSWLKAAAAVLVLYVAVLAGFLTGLTGFQLDRGWWVAPNLGLVVLYMLIGFYLMRTQLANRQPLGGWSVSGLALAVVFPTCGLMHLVFSSYALTGRYDFDIHGFVIASFGVPAATYFLWVVRQLHRGGGRDWNRPRTAALPARA